VRSSAPAAAAAMAPAKKNGKLEGTATVKGVAFFDFKHAGDIADNGIELHPVVKLTNVVCKRVPG
jgi:hypothetical protein